MGIGTRQIAIAFTVIALFTFAFISFGVNFQSEYEVNQSILGDSNINSLFQSTNSTFYNDESQMAGFQDTLYNDTETTEGGIKQSLLIGAVTGIAQSVSGVASGIFDFMFNPLLKALGLPQELSDPIGAFLSTIFLIITILMAWRLFRQGS